MSKQPSFEQLIDLFDGTLSASEQEQLRASLAEGSVSKDALWLEQFAQARAQVQLPAPPEHVRSTLRSLFAKKFAREPQPTLWQRVTAALSVDSWGMQGLPAGARSAEFASQSRQLAFATDTLDIVLDISDGTVNGQLLPKVDSADDIYTIQLLQDDESVVLVNSDDIGEFTISLDTGSYELVICNDAMEVWLPPLHLT